MVETLRKPSTGLKLGVRRAMSDQIEGRDTQKTQHGIETADAAVSHGPCVKRRDTQKTQHGIETASRRRESSQDTTVETLRKPSTGLKPECGSSKAVHELAVETLRKPSTGLKQPHRRRPYSVLQRRDTQKTQHGIETCCAVRCCTVVLLSRHSENPARD